MSPHLTSTQLSLFAAGDLEDAAAATLAGHVDDCAHCATRLAHADPLAGAFAEVQDPTVPVGLIEEILARATEASDDDEGRTRLRPEIWAAGGLLAAAAVLLGLTGGLTPWMAEVGVSVRAALVGGGVLLSNSPVSAGAVALGAFATLLGSAVLLVWRQRTRRR